MSLLDAIDAHWVAFKQEFTKTYATPAEEAERFRIFTMNMKDADIMNELSLATPGSSAVFGVTKFSDLRASEFKTTHLNYVPGSFPVDYVMEYTDIVDANVTKRDWRGNLTTPVKDQGDCGSCWAFSATEQIESMWLRKDKSKAVPLSAQQITSCDKADLGCNGGDTKSAYQSVIKEGGMMTEEAYPYTSGRKGKSGKCEFEKSKVVMTISSHANVGKKNEPMMRNYLGSTAPLSICVDASKWQNYKSGIMSPETCTKNKKPQLDHCVQLVGFAMEGGEKSSYYIVRNSWNTDWGEDGFIRLSTDHNTCGIADEPTTVAL
jgi:C1A family cysteine protease